MRLKLIILLAAVITVTNGQIAAIENKLIVVDSLNLTINPNNQIPRDGENSDSTDENSTSEQHNSEGNNESRVSGDTSQPKSEDNSNIQSRSSEDSAHIPSSESTAEEKSDSSDTGSQTSNENHGSGEKLSRESNEPGSVAASSSVQASSSGESPVTSTEDKIVQTTHGPVKGIRWKDSDILAYIDIPYGKFNKPFEAPVTAQSWLDVHYITQHTKRCPQIIDDVYIDDMNCLTLSVFTPSNTENASVLFYIHEYHTMSADPSVYGPEYLVPKDVILVLPNYRLGPMGFLCLQNETAQGNAALKDLSLAVEWVKENVYFFGGSPENIVVSGDGEAGAYASYLALCSGSKYYVTKVITESGTALSHWALDRDPIGTAEKLAEKIRLEHSDEVILNNTFNEVPLETIIKSAKGMRLNPCLERDKEPFIDSTPWQMLQDIEIDITFMIGSAKYAGTHEAVRATDNFTELLNNDFAKVLPDDLTFTNEEQKRKFAQELKTQYFGADEISVSDVEELSLWFTDASYLSPAIRLARPLLAAGVTVYFYEFAFVGSLNRELESMNKPVSGAVRSDIVGYLFHKSDAVVEDGTPERRMINLMVDLWVSFINHGKPSAVNVQWNELKRVDASEEEWLLIDSEPKLEKGIHVDRLQLWTKLYNEHFIERNAARRHKPHYYVPFVVSVICWIANNKLNNSSD